MDKTYLEPANHIPVAGEADVIVVGGGLAGIAAAVAAARNGASVVLLEKSCVLGGLATLGHVCIYMPLDDGLGHKVHGGLVEELLNVCIRYSYNTIPACWKGGPAVAENANGRYQSTFNIPACIMALDEFLADEHVETVFDTNFCAPIMEGDRCKGVIVENKSGRSAYMAKMVVDASGDCDVLFRAGAACETQKTIVSHWTYEVDTDKLKAEGVGDSPLDVMKMRWFGLRPDRDNSASTVPMFYGTTSEGVNGYLKLSRSLALDYLKKNQRDGYAMMTLPYTPQLRMTRRLHGMEEFEVIPKRHHEHSIGCVIHCLEHPEEVFEFPYEGIIDKRIKNIAAAGRIVSAGGRGWEIMRFIPSCVLTGQAAGTAAAMAVKADCTLQQVDVAALQEKLAATGIMIHMNETLMNNPYLDKKAQGVNGVKINTDSLAH